MISSHILACGKHIISKGWIVYIYWLQAISRHISSFRLKSFYVIYMVSFIDPRICDLLPHSLYRLKYSVTIVWIVPLWVLEAYSFTNFFHFTKSILQCCKIWSVYICVKFAWVPFNKTQLEFCTLSINSIHVDVFISHCWCSSIERSYVFVHIVNIVFIKLIKPLFRTLTITQIYLNISIIIFGIDPISLIITSCTCIFIDPYSMNISIHIYRYNCAAISFYFFNSLFCFFFV